MAHLHPPTHPSTQGVVAEASSVLGPGLHAAVAEFHRHGLFLYTWGDANNDYSSYMAQREAGVGALGGSLRAAGGGGGAGQGGEAVGCAGRMGGCCSGLAIAALMAALPTRAARQTPSSWTTWRRWPRPPRSRWVGVEGEGTASGCSSAPHPTAAQRRMACPELGCAPLNSFPHPANRPPP